MTSGSIIFVVLKVALLTNALNVPRRNESSLVFYNVPSDGAFLHNQDIYNSIVHHTGISSKGGMFSLSYVSFNSSPIAFSLAILMNSNSSFSDNSTTSRIIWTAESSIPVRMNSSLALQPDGDLVLRIPDGRVTWSTGTANMNASKLTLETTGNLVVYSFTGNALWQSFDHPSDVLMVDQLLRPGMKLVSRQSITDAADGVYTLVMEAGGLVLYSNLTGALEPYWIRSYYGLDDMNSVTTTCRELVVAVLRSVGQELRLSMELSNISAPPTSTSETLCKLTPREDFVLKRGNAADFNGSFVRLEYDGNLRAYKLGRARRWAVDPFTLFSGNNSCSLPQRCRPFGICSAGECTQCLSSDGTTSGWSDNCTAPKLTGFCNSSDHLEFVRLPGIERFSNIYLNGSPSYTRRFEECRSECMQSCSCSAFFYWEESGSCFTTGKIDTLEKVPVESHVAYIKMVKGERRKNSKLKGTVITGIVLITLVVLLAASSVACLWISKKRIELLKVAEAVDYDSDTFLDSLQSLKPMRFSFADMDRITSGFTKPLGTGGFGGVYEGQLPNGNKVAVKKLESVSQGKKEFYAEVGVLGNLHHWNLVKLLGFCSQRMNRLLVYEFMANGSLDKWIFGDEHVLSWKQRMDIMLGVARGLTYLHEECKQKIIHLDIKPQNILLDEQFVAKVADFGLSRLMNRDQSHVMTTMRGTPGYLAPEWLLEAAITEKSDVYSFGVVMLEVISGRRNFKRISEKQRFYLPALALKLARQGRETELLDGRLSDAEAEEVKRAVRIALQCIQEDSWLRPSMGKVVQMFERTCVVPTAVCLHEARTLSPQMMMSMLESSSSTDVSSVVVTWDSILSAR